jgi:methyl-accepting chemotaxis protein
MRWFHDRSTLAKLLGLVVGLCLITSGVGYLGVTTARVVKDDLDDVSSDLVPGSILAGRIEADIYQIGNDARSAVLASDAKETSDLIGNANQDLTDLDKDIHDFKALPMDATDTALIAQFDAKYPAWKAAMQQVLASAAKRTDADDAVASDMLLHTVAPDARALETTVGDLTTSQARQAAESDAQADASFDSATRLLIIVIAVSVAAGLGIGVFIARSLALPLQAMAAAAEAIAVGDLSQDVSLDRRDEVGRAVAAFRRAIAYLRGMAEVAEAMAEGDLSHDVEPASPRDVLGNAFTSMISNLRDLVGHVQSSANGLAEASAQLGMAATHTGAAVQQVAVAVQSLASSASETSQNADHTNAAMNQMSGAIDGIARGATEQARQVQLASATATEMANGVELVASNAQQVAAATQQTREAARQGAAAVRQTVHGMGEIQEVVSTAAEKVQDLGKLGDRIGQVVEMIDDIAEQTNLLALNAAIEAARAGEHGKGFAVVADEVRKLAERSGRETKAIGELIQQVQQRTQDAVSAMESGASKVDLESARADKAGLALDEILKAVESTVTQVTDIATEAYRMSASARTVNEGMQAVGAVVEENTAATEEMAAQSAQVSDAVQTIASIAQEQSASTEEISASAEEVNAQVEEMSAQAEELAATAEQLRTLVSRFKLQSAPAPVALRSAAALKRAA